MCRHLAYIGRPVTAAKLLLEPPHALVTQVDHPRRQAAGVDNRDGWGVAWRTGGAWGLHRSTVPMSADHDGVARLRSILSGGLVAAVRRASPGLRLVETGNAPFVADGLAFSLNGFVGGFTSGGRGALLDELSEAGGESLRGDTDSEVLFALVRDHLAAGHDPASALGEVIGLALDAAGTHSSRLNLLLSDGQTVWATRWGNSLFHRRSAEGDVVVASEPWDDDPAWLEVADRSVLVATPQSVAVAPLAASAGTA